MEAMRTASGETGTTADGRGGLGPTLSADLAAMFPPDGESRVRRALVLAARYAVTGRLRVLVQYRLGHALARRGWGPPAQWLLYRAQRAGGAEISPYASFGPGLTLAHSVGIVVGPEVRVGRNAILFHGVTLGDGPRPGQPVLGHDVTVGAGASVLGGVRIGDRVVIGAHTVVTEDVPSDVVAVGSPVRHRPLDSVSPVWRRGVAARAGTASGEPGGVAPA